MENTQIEVAANVAQLPTSADLSEKLALLTTERDKAEKIATDAHNAIHDCKTSSDIQKALDVATSAANRHETLIRAAERVEGELSAATARESQAEQARQAAEFADLVIQLATQAHAQKLIAEETLRKLAIEIEDRILNALDELSDAKSSHAKTVELYMDLKKSACRFSPTSQGQTRSIPESRAQNGHVLLAHTATDYELEEAQFNQLFRARGIDVSSVKSAIDGIENTAKYGAAKFIFDLANCKSRGETLRAEFSNIPPFEITYSSSTSHGYGNTDATANADPGPARLTNPELFSQSEWSEAFEAQQSQDAEKLAQESLEPDRELYDAQKPHWAKERSADRQPTDEDGNSEQARQQRIDASSEILYRSDTRATEW